MVDGVVEAGLEDGSELCVQYQFQKHASVVWPAGLPRSREYSIPRQVRKNTNPAGQTSCTWAPTKQKFLQTIQEKCKCLLLQGNEVKLTVAAAISSSWV
jgi:hypothetical protein